jgi:radical SAM protein with 4Fe4S-binding SPASM domain
VKQTPILTDLYRHLKKITVKKTGNLTSLMISYLISKVSGKMVFGGYPLTLSIELTNHCNLRCPECRSGSGLLRREKGYMDMTTFDRILSDCSSFLFSMILYFQGEPFLHRELFEMIKKARQKRLHTMTSTNGQFLDPDTTKKVVESGLDRIIISMDGLDQAVYEKYRIGGNLERVKDGIRELIGWKKTLRFNTPEIIIQFLVFSHNQHQIEEIRKWSQRVGADGVEIKTARMDDFEKGNPLMPEEQYTRYRKKSNGQFLIDSPLKNHCWQCWSKAVITWDGNVLPCCFDTNGDFVMGNILQQSFIDIWKGTPYKNFKTKLLQNRKEIPMCCNCTEGVSYYVH